ncbi:hypothetical protein MTO96_025681 [Rhipicephalus appendiculatus]
MKDGTEGHLLQGRQSLKTQVLSAGLKQILVTVRMLLPPVLLQMAWSCSALLLHWCKTELQTRELRDVLEKEHHVSPTILLAPGNMVEKENSAPTAEEDRGTSSVADVEQPGVADQEQRHAQKRKKEGSSLDKLLKELQERRK